MTFWIILVAILLEVLWLAKRRFLVTNRLKVLCCKMKCFLSIKSWTKSDTKKIWTRTKNIWEDLPKTKRNLVFAEKQKKINEKLINVVWSKGRAKVQTLKKQFYLKSAKRKYIFLLIPFCSFSENTNPFKIKSIGKLTIVPTSY